MAELMVARITLHLTWKLFAPKTAETLKDGDVAEEKIRQLLLSEFQKIHEHLNALRRKELVAAVSYLENGFQLVKQDVITAVEEFKKARDAAQMAFGVVPDITDKILASKILVTASFHEFDKNIDTALTLSSKYLERLNTLPEVVKVCEFFYSPDQNLGKKILAKSGNQKRELILHGVAEINKSVYDFFKGRLDGQWVAPVIRFQRYHINPIYSMALKRKQILITEIEKDISGFLAVTVTNDQLFAALAHETGASMANDILAINLLTGHKTHLLGHNAIVLTLCSNEKHLFSGSYDKDIIIWNLEDLQPIKVLSGHTGSVRSLCVSENKLFSGAADKTMRVWDLSSFECGQVVDFEEAITKVTCSRRKFLFLIHGPFKVQIWDINKMERLHEIETDMCVCNNIIANDNILYIPAKNKEGEIILCYNLGSLTLDNTIMESGSNFAKFYNSPYIYIGKKSVRMINTSTQRLIMDQNMSVYSNYCEKIKYMFVHDADLFVLAEDTATSLSYLIKF